MSKMTSELSSDTHFSWSSFTYCSCNKSEQSIWRIVLENCYLHGVGRAKNSSSSNTDQLHIKRLQNTSQKLAHAIYTDSFVVKMEKLIGKNLIFLYYFCSKHCMSVHVPIIYVLDENKDNCIPLYTPVSLYK